MTTYTYVDFDNLTSTDVDMQKISIYGRIHTVRKSSSNMCFLILRNQLKSLQCLCLKKIIGVDKFNNLIKLSKETVIILKGHISNLPENQPLIKSCSYQTFEFNIEDFEIISEPQQFLPFQIDDANVLYSEERTENDRAGVNLDTRLNNRYFELRTPLNNAIFRLQSSFVNSFREYLTANDFVEIHTPKLLGTSSETGASVFKVDYFNTNAFLAQSPQLYKQMAINADFKKVFEIGPVFRAENSFSNRHLCEFTGMDIEMSLTPPFDYIEIVNVLWNTLIFMFKNIETNCTAEINYIKSYHNFEQFVCPSEPLIITFTEGVELLKTEGFEQDITKDLETINERKLGEIIRKTRGSDLFVLTEYPTSARPFYTKKTNDGNFTKSYDIIMRGNEILSGAQRENDYNTLINQMTNLGIKLEPFEDYLNSFKYGSFPHGGGGFGLERILMLYFDLGSVKTTSMFPRDPERLRP